MPRPTNLTSNRPAVLFALLASAVLTALIIVGSRNLEHYDAALFGYTVASGRVAVGARCYLLARPATRALALRWACFATPESAPNTRSAARRS